MSVPLLATKLNVPPLRPERVPRPRLVERLIQGLDRKLTLVSAPAGFGKTTLLSDCAAGCGRSVAWLSLDVGDNDPSRFWTYVIAAIQMVPGLKQAGVGRSALAMLGPSRLAGVAASPPVDVLLTGLINDINEAAIPFVLVLDDLHVVIEPQIHDGLIFLVDRLPPPSTGMHLVVATRADPPWPLARLRVRGQIMELRTGELRFTTEEAASFLNDVMGFHLPAEAIVALDARIEGWIAGLQMAALSMQGRLLSQGPAELFQFIDAFAGSHRFVLDYLVEEVLEQQSPAVQDFLLRTSILERVSAPLCDAVLGRAASAAQPSQTISLPGSLQASRDILEHLEKANLFIMPLDEERRWYRYHHLFADLLVHRLRQRYPDEVPALHLRASEWFEQQGLLAEALTHVLAVDAVERVAHLIENHTLFAVFYGRLTTLLDWLQALPDEVMRQQPWLSVGYAWALASAGRWETVEPLLEAAERLVLSEPAVSEAEARRIMGHIVTLRAYAAGIKGEIRRAKELALLGLELVPRYEVPVYCFAANMLGAALRYSGELAAGAQVLAEAAALSRTAGEIENAIALLGALGALQIEQGRLGASLATSREVLRLASSSEHSRQDFLLLAPTHTRLSNLFREWNDLQAALQHAQESIRLGELWGHAEALATGYGALAFALQAVGDQGGATRMMHKAQQLSNSLSVWYGTRQAADQAWLWLMQGNLVAAVDWSMKSGLSIDEIAFDCLPAYVVFAHVLVVRGLSPQAIDLLARLLALAELAGAGGLTVAILVQQALAHHALQQDTPALLALERALTLAEPENYIRSFVDQGPAMAALLRQAAARQVAPQYIPRLLAAFPDTTAREGGGSRPALDQLPGPKPTEDLIEPLSDRECEVLRLLNTSLSTPEIAAELVIAVSTVRSHIKSIYSKLDAHGRIEAVHRARELGLL